MGFNPIGLFNGKLNGTLNGALNGALNGVKNRPLALCIHFTCLMFEQKLTNCAQIWKCCLC